MTNNFVIPIDKDALISGHQTNLLFIQVGKISHCAKYQGKKKKTQNKKKKKKKKTKKAETQIKLKLQTVRYWLSYGKFCHRKAKLEKWTKRFNLPVLFFCSLGVCLSPLFLLSSTVADNRLFYLCGYLLPWLPSLLMALQGLIQNRNFFTHPT